MAECDSCSLTGTHTHTHTVQMHAGPGTPGHVRKYNGPSCLRRGNCEQKVLNKRERERMRECRHGHDKKSLVYRENAKCVQQQFVAETVRVVRGEGNR